MKATVFYYSKTGKTKEMAEYIVNGMRAEGVEAKAFSVDAPDEAWAKESRTVLVGTPVYYADVSADTKRFLETLGKYNVAGKLGGAFATAAYSYGGGDIALQTIFAHMLVCGMMPYSGGGAYGNPVIHLGPVYSANSENTGEELFTLYGKRMAKQMKAIFND